MSVNVYVSEEITKQAEYLKDPAGGISFKGTCLSKERDGSIYTVLGDSGIVPAHLVQFVVVISLHEYIPCDTAKRELGIYKFDDAEAEVTHQTGGGDRLVYKVAVKAKNLDTARELCRKIKTGTIRPVESYESPQMGKSRDELEAEVTELQGRLEKLQSNNVNIIQKSNSVITDLNLAQSRVNSVLTFISKLGEKWWQWPWCSKQKIADQILLSIRDAKPKGE